MIANNTLTAIPGLRVGQHTLLERPTGCTVILLDDGAVAGVDVRGGAPGTRETDALNPVNTIDRVHAIVFAGGSAYGLDAASGVVRYLDERNIGLKLGSVNVPIVPAAVIFDLAVGTNPAIRPDARCGYEAARTASSVPVLEGNVGAGAGATVGKGAGHSRAMKGGLGSAAVTTSDGLIVAALMVVNAFGDVVDPATNKTIAGVRTPDGTKLMDVRTLITSGSLADLERIANTTLGAVATNALLTKAEVTKVAQMAHDGFARAIVPVHTPCDGDSIFVLATGARPGKADILRIGALAAEVTTIAILRAISEAQSIPGYPASRDLR